MGQTKDKIEKTKMHYENKNTKFMLFYTLYICFYVHCKPFYFRDYFL